MSFYQDCTSLVTTMWLCLNHFWKKFFRQWDVDWIGFLENVFLTTNDELKRYLRFLSFSSQNCLNVSRKVTETVHTWRRMEGRNWNVTCGYLRTTSCSQTNTGLTFAEPLGLDGQQLSVIKWPPQRLNAKQMEVNTPIVLSPAALLRIPLLKKVERFARVTQGFCAGSAGLSST